MRPIIFHDVLIDIGDKSLGRLSRRLIRKGTYEIEELDLARRHFKPGVPLVELGAGIGAISCVLNKHLGPSQQIAVEANPRIIPSICNNMRLNSIDFDVVNAAIVYDCNTVPFPLQREHLGGRIGKTSKQMANITSISLSELVSRYNLGQFNLICDIEGYELHLFEHEAEIIKNHIQIMVIELHFGKNNHKFASKIISLGFMQVEMKYNAFCFEKESKHSPRV